MWYYIGLDLHGRNTFIGVMDQDGKRIYGTRLSNSLELILKVLEPFKEKTFGVVVESTFNWYWLVDGLIEAGYSVRLAHPAANVQYNGLKHTDDRSDSFFLAELLRLNILKEGYIFPQEERQLRDLLRKRMQLVQQRTRHILSFKSLVNRNTSEHLSANAIKMLQPDGVDGWFENPHLTLSAKANLECIRHLSRQILTIEKAIMPMVCENPAYDFLMSISGIGKVLTMTILLETGVISRFKEAGNYASYCRCVKSKKTSNDKLKGQNNRKNGNKYLGWAFVEAAQHAKRFFPAARAFYDKKAKQRNTAVATKALAHKLARACFYVMRDLKPFESEKVFGKEPLETMRQQTKLGTGLTEPSAPIGLAAASPTINQA